MILMTLAQGDIEKPIAVFESEAQGRKFLELINLLSHTRDFSRE